MSQEPVVLITGGSRGLGREMALAFAKRKFRVGINYSTGKNEAEDTADLVGKAGGEPLTLKADVSDSKEVDRMMKSLVEKWGRLDILINNAGIARNKLLVQMNDEDWNKVLEVNLTGAFYCSRAAIPVMRRQKEGQIFCVASYLAKRTAAGVGNYAVSKAGLISLTKSIAKEEGRFNIRANVVLPGFHVTGLNRDLWPKIEAEIREQHLLPQLARKEDFGEFVFALSQFKNITGQEFAFEGRLL